MIATLKTIEAIKDYITKEQATTLDKVSQHEYCAKTYGDEYYHGYYNGYLTALYNLKVVIKLNEGDNLK